MKKLIHTTLAIGALFLMSNVQGQIVENRNFEYEDPRTFANDSEFHAWFKNQRAEQVAQAREATRAHVEQHGDQWGFDNTGTQTHAEFQRDHKAKRAQEVEQAIQSQPADWKQD